jgi:hypothetical protein
MRPRGRGVGFSHESIAMSLGVRLCQRIVSFVMGEHSAGFIELCWT